MFYLFCNVFLTFGVLRQAHYENPTLTKGNLLLSSKDMIIQYFSPPST